MSEKKLFDESVLCFESISISDFNYSTETNDASYGDEKYSFQESSISQVSLDDFLCES